MCNRLKIIMNPRLYRILRILVIIYNGIIESIRKVTPILRIHVCVCVRDTQLFVRERKRPLVDVREKSAEEETQAGRRRMTFVRV